MKFILLLAVQNPIIGLLNLQPIEKIGDCLKDKGVLFHTDAVQAAAAAAAAQMEQRAAYEIELRDYFIKKVLGEIPGTKLNGDPKKRLPGNCSFTFPLVSGESILIMLDRRGICASAGSACAAGAIEPSHVLSALGLSREDAYSTLRFTLSYRNTKEELDYTAAELKKIVEELRSVSPYA